MGSSNPTLEQAVTKALLVFAEVLANPRDVTAQLVRAWVLTLGAAGVRPEEVEAAVGRLLATQTFFPTPADFLKAVRPPEDAEAAVELAWQRTLAALRRLGGNASLQAADFEGDAAALWAVSRMGWDRLSAELTVDNRAIWRAEFVRTYRLGTAHGAELHYLPGRMELKNRADAQIMAPALCGRPDWKELPEWTEETPALPASPPELPASVRLAGMLGSVGKPMPAADPDPDIPEPLRQWADRPAGGQP